MKATTVRAVRLPLQIGSAALKGIAWAAALIVPALLLPSAGCAMALATPGGSQLMTLGFLAAGGLMFFAWRMLAAAPRRRATDIVLLPEGIAFVGGPHHGFELQRDEIQSDSWRIDERLGGGTLVMGLPGEDFVVAEAHGNRELLSLREVLETVHATYGEADRDDGGAGAVPKASRSDVLHCSECGGIAVPEDRDTITCAFCAVEFAVPAELRARVRDAEERRVANSRSELLLEKLLAQPEATGTNRLIAMVAVPMLFAWPVAAAVGLSLWVADKLGDGHAVALCLFPLAAILGLFLILAARIGDRRALQLVTLHLAAIPLDAACQSYCCRECGGALPSSSSQILVECVYCGAHNVLGIHLRHEIDTQVAQRWRLEDAFAQRSARRRWGALSGAVGVVLCVLAGWALARGRASKGVSLTDVTKRTQPSTGDRVEVCVRSRADTLPLPSRPDGYHCVARQRAVGGHWPDLKTRMPGILLRGTLRAQSRWRTTTSAIVRDAASGPGAARLKPLDLPAPGYGVDLIAQPDGDYADVVVSVADRRFVLFIDEAGTND